MLTASHLRDARRDRALLGVLLLALAGVAWLALLAWSASPAGRFLHHEGGAEPLALGAALFTAGWLLMIMAMMLPSSVPLVLVFAALVGRRTRSRVLVALLLSGYLAVWGAFGLAAWLLDRAVHAAVAALPWLAAHPQLILGATLLAGGLWQFSPLRDHCLDACRSPLGFVLDRWRGTAERTEAIRLGIAHGAFCVGCCWSLMLVLFAVGLSSVPAMLVLGGLTAIEKTMPWGRRLTRPVGLALILAAVAAVAS
jgi:predicted metal-binding membrane protein